MARRRTTTGTTTATTAGVTAGTTTGTRVATPINLLGLKEYDLVKTAGKGIGIVLRKQSLNDELVIYSMSSANITHPNDDDGMAKVRRYDANGKIATTSETTGRKLRNRAVYTITGVKSYANPVLAMKDFINQNPAIEFDPIVAPTPVEVPAATPTEVEILTQILSSLEKMNSKLDEVRALV